MLLLPLPLPLLLLVPAVGLLLCPAIDTGGVAVFEYGGGVGEVLCMLLPWPLLLPLLLPVLLWLGGSISS